MAAEGAEFSQLVNGDLVSADTDVKRLATQRLHVLMTGAAAVDEATAGTAVKALADAISAALT